LKNLLTKITIAILFAISLTACGTSPQKSTPEMKGQLFAAPADKVYAASTTALGVLECGFSTNTPTYIACTRERKMGVMVGSGGETISVYIEAKTPTSSEVKVDTAKHFVGILGQSNWDDEVLAEIEKALVTTTKPKK
jgi:hypothetical protein